MGDGEELLNGVDSRLSRGDVQLRGVYPDRKSLKNSSRDRVVK